MSAPPAPPSAALRSVLWAGGLVATGAGIHTALAGARSIPGHRGGTVDPRLESELRFYGVFYAAYGIGLGRAAARETLDVAQIRGLAAVLWAAGAARAAGWRRVGRPSPAQVALLAVELAGPPLVLASAGRRPAAPGPQGATPRAG